MAGQLWGTDSLGGYMYQDELSDYLRVGVQTKSRYRQFCDAKDAAAKGVGKGENYHWNVYNNVATQGTTLTEGTAMPETNFTVTQGTLTVTEYGNSIPWSGKAEALAAHSIQDVCDRQLRNDAVKAFDTAAHGQFNATPLRVVPTAGTSTTALTLTTNGTATLTNNVAFGLAHAKLVVDLMKERDIPAYIEEDYYALAWPTTLRPFKNDLESVHQYTPAGFDKLFKGEVGRYDNVRYVEQSNISKSSWANAKSDWVFFFGDDTVAEGMVISEELRLKFGSDYGRSFGLAWYYIGGFGLVHSVAAQARIVKWDSAA